MQGRATRGMLLATAIAVTLSASAHAAPCDTPANPIVAENCLPGDSPDTWDVSGAGDPSIQGFATDISVNRGQTVLFKIDTDSTSYRLDIYRIGYYGGMGARRVATVQPTASLPQNQPACLTDPSTGLVDCGNWAVSASWNVPTNATSGIYFALLVREDATPGASHVVFVVRDDNGGSDLFFQTSDTTWQAYNQYGGNSLYVGSPAGRAFKVSYNRPFTTRGPTPEDWVFNAEYPMVRWLEANGYDVSYTTGVDTARRGAELLEHRVFLSVGHDEYWSGDQRANVEAARDAGLHLAFFSGNEVFWKTRWENSVDGSSTPYRTLVTYKETHANAKIDPLPNVWTGTWRDPRFSPPADGGRPENGLTGTIFTVNCCSDAITVPSADGRMRFWRNTTVASLGPGQTATLPPETLGYEWDEDLDNGVRPPGLVRLSTTTLTEPQRLLDFGSNYGTGTATHRLVLHRQPNGALVFGAGTVQWSWGLDDNHDRGSAPPDVRMQQATVNLLADMGVQPATRQPGLVAATASTDGSPPSAAITSPADGAVVASGGTVAISGTAADGGGGVVGGVEVSVDGGTTWHPASGRAAWSYSWTVPVQSGSITLLARAVDDSGNLGAPGAPVTVTTGGFQDPNQGPGGPILVITRPADPFGRYYAEILRAEGLQAFAVADIASVSASTLAGYDVVVLASMPLNAAQVSMLTSWVTAGGNLIAMRPDAQLASLLGLTAAGSPLSNAYLLVNTAAGPGAGIVGQTIQFHGAADRYTTSGATAVATLYANASSATANPAVTLRSVGTMGGQAAAFTYDLARSVVYTRQGNPAWAGQERDGTPPRRSDDLFFGNAAGDPQPDWVDLGKVAIPQADEQQRLLANLILQMNLDRKPLPRFWYLPRGLQAAVLMSGDDHGNGGTAGRFDGYIADSPPGCSVPDWECVRSTSYVYPGTPNLDNAVGYSAEGFEISIHVLTNCEDWTPASLDAFFDNQLDALESQLEGLPPPASERNHCIAWSDWATQPKVENAHGMRLDTNYYYWPPDWVQDRPGLFTGSGMPMRFADVDGTMIDVYQAVTQMTDESGQTFPFTIDTLLDRALGPEGYYGVFTANMHTDSEASDGSDAIVASAQARGVPIVSGRQMLEWLDGRNGAAFGSISWSVDTLRFTVGVAAGVNGLQAMLPTHSARGVLGTITLGGSPVAFTPRTIKGIEYAFFPAAAGQYVARYPVPGDTDGDGWAPPADCNDHNAAMFPGAPELCDGLDNDCNGTADDPFPDVGAACTVGVGACAATGLRVCTGEGTSTVCNAIPGTPTTERCDGIDNDCDGQVDEAFTDLNTACTVGVGDCSRTGVKVCLGNGSGTTCSVTPGTPTTEVCDGHDNDCDGQIDDSPSDAGQPCNTGQLGTCAAGTRQCQGGALQCVRNTGPSGERCNGLDDDCDGSVDETFADLGGTCSVGIGDCARTGVKVCLGDGSGTTCGATPGAPATEICDGHDNDCDGQIDDGNPGGGGSCTTGQQGVCSAGTMQCQSGGLVCVRNVNPTSETCNGVDDNCNGAVDEGTGGGSCTTGLPGVCAEGTRQCQGGTLLCVANAAVPEICDGQDNDCDGAIDEGNPGGGAACTTGESGVCAAGTMRCEEGTLTCVRDVEPSGELCGTGLDEDCNGQTDEPGCIDCLPADSVTAPTQTLKTSVKLSPTAARDSAQTKGSFRLPSGLTLAPDGQDVMLRLTDGTGTTYYSGTIPAGSFVASSSRRSFKFNDRTMAHAGVRASKFTVAGDGTLVKYSFKMKGLDEPPFIAGTGTALIKIGPRCFADPSDACTLSGSGRAARCK